MIRLTGVDEELVGDSGMVHVVNCTCKDGSEDLKVCEYSLEEKRQEHREERGKRGERGERRGERESNRCTKIPSQATAIDWTLSRSLIEADC